MDSGNTTTTHEFKPHEVEELVQNTEAETPEEALDIWAHRNYPIRNVCDISAQVWVEDDGSGKVDITEQNY